MRTARHGSTLILLSSIIGGDKGCANEFVENMGRFTVNDRVHKLGSDI